MDTFGRKKVIIAKVACFLVLEIILIALGFIGKKGKQAVPALYFITMFFATFSFDLEIIGFESIIKEKRENFIITLSALRIIAIGLLCISFYFIKRWVYFVVIQAGLTFLFLILFTKFTFESPPFVMTSTA